MGCMVRKESIMTTLQLDSRIIKGLTKEEAVEAVANTKATMKQLKNDIAVITNEDAKTGKSRIQYIEMYVDAVLQFVAAQQEQAPTEVAHKEETTMTTNTTTTPVTMEQMNEQMMKMMEGMMTVLNTTLDAHSKQLGGTLMDMDDRITKASRYTKSLEQRIATLSAPTTPEVAATTQEPTIEGPTTEGGTTMDVNKDEVVYTAEQIKAIANMEKKVGKEGAKQVKETFEKMNRSLGHTVGNILNGTSEFLDEKGHMGVDSVSDLVGKTIDSVKAITVSLIDLTATTLHSANEIGRTAGHIIINGTVYTLDAAGNMVAKKN